MLKDAERNAKRTKYAKNKRHGMYEGTPSMMNLAPERCPAPKTANGTTKHKLLKATIFSSPPARTIYAFTTNSATMKSMVTALPSDTTVRDRSKNVSRMDASMWMPNASTRTQDVARFSAAIK